jgi:hypothetical protein
MLPVDVAGDPGLAPKCEAFVETKDLLSAPQSYVGQRLCVRGKVLATYSHPGAYVLVPSDFRAGATPEVVLYVTALGPIRDRLFELGLKDGDFVEAFGTISYDKQCWENAGKANPDGSRIVCVPEKPIYLDLKYLRRR